ncbi:inner membrane protein, 60 kDa [Ceratobasidium sp. AG-Ba]|nr:inner membrane protein, 60 kDa [Ceratobasidium sp. AG-Ba]QRW01460.1 inner membrane protein, 60 kDa [Ceratobasidium sp. AG-Ba]
MNPLATESFLTLPSLAHTDPTGMLPIAVGLLMFSNVELGRLSRPAKRQMEPAPSNDNSGETSPTELPRMSSMVSALENGLRGVSILFIWIAMQSPGAVVLYWLTSAAYTLAERLYFINFGNREPKPVDQAVVQNATPLPSSPKGRNARRAKP